MTNYIKNKQDTLSESCPECRKPIEIGQSTVTGDNTLYHLDCAFRGHKADTTNQFIKRLAVGAAISLALLVSILLISVHYASAQGVSPGVSIPVATYDPDEPVVKTRDSTKQIMLVRVITYPSYESLAAANFREDKIPFVGKLLGWYIMRGDVCEIHVLEPKLVQSIRPAETWGHELMHCTYGNYHK